MIMKNHRLWIKITAALQILTAAAHSMSFFSSPAAENDTEKQMIGLITTYRKDLGGGFQPTFYELFTALSSCFALMYVFGGILLFYLLKREVDSGTMKGVLNLSIFVYGVCFAVMAVFTFPPPIVLTGLVFAGLIVSRLMLKG